MAGMSLIAQRGPGACFFFCGLFADEPPSASASSQAVSTVTVRLSRCCLHRSRQLFSLDALLFPAHPSDLQPSGRLTRPAGEQCAEQSPAEDLGEAASSSVR